MTEIENLNSNSKRILGFDLIRLISFFVVSYYHFTYAVWHGREAQFYAVTAHDWLFNHTMHPFERAMASSGHILLFLSMILIGLAKKSFKTLLRFSLFLLSAWLLFIWAESGFTTVVAAWDIHPLIFLGLLTIGFVEMIQPRLVLLLGAIGFVTTWFRYVDLPTFSHLDIYARSILVGDCAYGVSSWPVLPWLGFLYFGYAVGFALRDPRLRQSAKHLGSIELGFWIALLSAALFRVGAYYRIPMHRWECDAFLLPAQDFYSDFIFVLFAIRLSLLARVDAWLKRACPWLSRLNVSKNFFLAYALQYAMSFLVALLFADELRSHSQLYMWTGLAMLPVAELTAYLAAQLGARRFFKG